MFWNILHRLVFWELVKVFVLSLVVITGILLMAGLLKEAPQRGLGMLQVLELIPLIVPATLPFTIPCTLLFATCLVYGRLSRDNEILAIKAAGINVLHVARPALVLGLLLSSGTMGLYYYLIPYTQHLMRLMLLEDAEEVFYSMLRNERQINIPSFSYIIFARAVQDYKLIDPILKHRDAGGNYDLVVCGREGELRVDMPRRQILVRMHDGELCKENSARVHFLDQVWEVPLPAGFGTDHLVKPIEMTWQFLLQRRGEVRAEEETLAAQIADTTGQVERREAAGDLPRQLADLKEKRLSARLELSAVETELQKRPAMALGCLCFVLVGCPVGIWLSRGDYLSTFMTSFLPIALVYYPMGMCGFVLARKGYIDPVPALWTANVVLLLAAVVLFRRLLKH